MIKALTSLKKKDKLELHRGVTRLCIVDFDSQHCKDGGVRIRGCWAYNNQDPPIMDNGLPPKSVNISCSSPIDLRFATFNLCVWEKNGVSQCDALLFPAKDDADDAVLLVETKYVTSDSEYTLKEAKDKALKQIKDTLNELKIRQAPIEKREAYGLISFPVLDTVSATLISPNELREIYETDNIRISIGNYAYYESPKNIKFAKDTP
jgi:hypothetical protein